MNIKVLILAVLVVSVFLAGCAKSSNDYSAYATGNPQGQQQPYVGGGCGVAPSGNYANTQVEALDASDSAL
jgi:hypothetical protein